MIFFSNFEMMKKRINVLDAEEDRPEHTTTQQIRLGWGANSASRTSARRRITTFDFLRQR
jgi:hypothetical protein